MGAVNAFSHMAQRMQYLVQRLALRQGHANLSVTAQVTCRGQHQVAQSTQAHERICTSTHGQTQACHFSQATGDQGRTCVQTQLHAITQTGGNRHDVFHRTTNLNTDHIVVGIHTQVVAVKSLHQSLSHRGMFAGRHQGSGLSSRHLLGKARTTQHTCQHAGRNLGLYLVGQQTLAPCC